MEIIVAILFYKSIVIPNATHINTGERDERYTISKNPT